MTTPRTFTAAQLQQASNDVAWYGGDFDFVEVVEMLSQAARQAEALEKLRAFIQEESWTHCYCGHPRCKCSDDLTKQVVNVAPLLAELNRLTTPPEEPARDDPR